MPEFEKIFPICRSLLPQELWQNICASQGSAAEPTVFLEQITSLVGRGIGIPAYFSEVARLEEALYPLALLAPPPKISLTEKIIVNPTLILMVVGWKNLATLFAGEAIDSLPPEPGDEMLLLWLPPGAGVPVIRAALDRELLALKLILEDIEPRQAAALVGQPVRLIDDAVDWAVAAGILLKPPSKIVRDGESFPLAACPDSLFLVASVFTLQWHITQTCDLNCKHCYDRSDRLPLALETALRILDELYDFCRNRQVYGQVSFSGGNPLLYPQFDVLYQRAADLGLSAAILGNPTPRQRLAELIAIQKPVFYQVSLEGLEAHNDLIRGPGHFKRTMAFLDTLRELGICSLVMLTLTRDNMDQVLPLGEMLHGKIDGFNFNRLSMVGSGAQLSPVDREKYAAFLSAYQQAALTNPVLHFKDNLFNILRHRQGEEWLGGCTGHGCGAAFNFLTLLSDGEVHACRKFPSPLGSIYDRRLSAIYDSEMARKYRRGCEACRACPIRPVCGGCLSIAHSFGHDVFTQPDPYCFIHSA